ncbi:MAG: acyltransferase [Actinomycetota bacterium]|nr:acyltransferase [Actinomycetota bacterium]
MNALTAETITVARSPTSERDIPADRGAGSGTQITQAGERRSARVESLRAIAAVSVLASHAFVYGYGVSPVTVQTYWHRVFLEGGFGGVDLFYALSGYLLFWPMARSAFATHEPVDLRRYALNRVVRILPLYYTVLVVLLVVQNHGGSVSQWWHFGLFAENFSTSSIFTVDAPMWTLAIEVQFYIALPLLAWLLVSLARGSRARTGLLLLGLAVASVVLYEVAATHRSPSLFIWQYSLPSVFFFFVAGMLLALLRVGWLERPPRWLQGWAGRSDLWVAASLPLWLLACYRGTYQPVAAIAAMLIIGSCVMPLRRGAFVRLTELRPLSRLGLSSYSLYLWQAPVLIVLAGGAVTGGGKLELIPTPAHLAKMLVLGLLITVPLALASYALIEAPPLRLRRRWAGQGGPAPSSR